MSSLVYYRLFTPEEIKEPLAEFSTAQVTRETTQLRIGPDSDGERERIFKIQLMTDRACQSTLPKDEDIAIVIRLGSAVIPERRDPLYVMISDDDKAIGFKISESGPIKGAEGSAGKFLDPVRLSGKTRVAILLFNVNILQIKVARYSNAHKYLKQKGAYAKFNIFHKDRFSYHVYDK